MLSGMRVPNQGMGKAWQSKIMYVRDVSHAVVRYRTVRVRYKQLHMQVTQMFSLFYQLANQNESD